MAKKYTFDSANPDRDLIRMVLHQAFGSGSSVKEIMAEVWSLGDFDDWKPLIKHMEQTGLIEESAEPGYHRITSKGQDYLDGRDDD